MFPQASMETWSVFCQKQTWTGCGTSVKENPFGLVTFFLNKTNFMQSMNVTFVNSLICFSLTTGLNDRESTGRWEWVGGEPVTYTNWRQSLPKNRKKETRKCVLVWRKTKWQIRDCKKGKGHRYVCYVKMWDCSQHVRGTFSLRSAQ